MKRKLMIAVFILTLVAGGTFAQATAKATVELAISGTTPLGIRLSYTVEAYSESDAIAKARQLYYAQYQNRAGTVIEAFSTVKWLNGPPPSSSSSPSSPEPSTPAINITGYSTVRSTPSTPAPTPQYGISKDQLGTSSSTPRTSTATLSSNALTWATALVLGQELSVTLDLNEERVYKFRIENNTSFVVETRGSLDTKLYLYNNSGERITYDDDSGEDRNARISRSLSSGWYYIELSSYQGRSGECTLVTSIQ
jgi:hypothetical protein